MRLLVGYEGPGAEDGTRVTLTSAARLFGRQANQSTGSRQLLPAPNPVLLIGAVSAAGLTRFATSLFHGVSPTDSVTFAGALGLLGVAGVIAALVPALRAARSHPAERLRQG